MSGALLLILFHCQTIIHYNSSPTGLKIGDESWKRKKQLTPRWKQKNKPHTNRDTHRFFLGRWVARWIKFPLRPFFREACRIQRKTFSSLFAKRVQFFARCLKSCGENVSHHWRDDSNFSRDVLRFFSFLTRIASFPRDASFLTRHVLLLRRRFSFLARRVLFLARRVSLLVRRV